MMSVPYRLLSYQCQLIIIGHMDANQRIHFSMHCPTIRSMEISIPFKIDTLELRPLKLKLNGHVYEIDCLRRNHVTKESQFMNNDAERQKYFGLSQNLGVTVKDKRNVYLTKEWSEVTKSFRYAESVMFPQAYSDYLVLSECGKVREYLDYTLSVWDAMGHLIKKIFNGRGSVKIGHVIIDDHGLSEDTIQRIAWEFDVPLKVQDSILKGFRNPQSQPILNALPVDFKLKINLLELKTLGRQEDKDLLQPYAKSIRQVGMKRILFNRQQIHVLQNRFDQNRYLSVLDREALAAQLGLTPTQVKIWFQHSRHTLMRQRRIEAREQ